MPTTKPSKRALLSEYLLENRPARITEAVQRELALRLAPVSDSYLRRLLRDCGIPLDTLVEGVRQDSLDELERTLLAVDALYASACSSGNRELEGRCRGAVLTAKEHARLSVRRGSPETRRLKEEMISWLLTWLENPQAFASWLRLRRRKLAAGAGLLNDDGLDLQ